MPRNWIGERAAVFIREFLLEPALRYHASSAGRSAMADRFSYAPVAPAHLGRPAGSPLPFARDRYYWSPPRVARLLWGVVTTIPCQLQLLRVMKEPIYSKLLQNEPRFRFKFLIRDYLVRDFSAAQRTACFLHHYKRLHSGMSVILLQQILHRSVTVLEVQKDDIHVGVTLCYSRPFEKEGELSFNLLVDEEVVYVLSFTIAPGWVVQSDAREVLLISRLQGTNGYYPQIRAATKALHDVGPAALLLAALHGFAKAFDITQMASVSAVRQSTYTEDSSLSYKRSYDDFFSELNLERSPSGFFFSVVPPEDRPMSSIKKGHKIRTREKRQFKRHIAENVCLLLRRG